tara:strand:- start:4251 stop:4571 length:321 start_codon:yes stop_codon:yes gene_type:complete
MFKKSILISLSVFFILMSFTSFIKNKARNIEKNIEKLNQSIAAMEVQLLDAKTDFVYLSSPEQLRYKIKNLSTTEYYSYDHSRIFLSTEEFLDHISKQTNKNKKFK